MTSFIQQIWLFMYDFIHSAKILSRFFHGVISLRTLLLLLTNKSPLHTVFYLFVYQHSNGFHSSYKEQRCASIHMLISVWAYASISLAYLHRNRTAGTSSNSVFHQLKNCCSSSKRLFQAPFPTAMSDTVSFLNLVSICCSHSLYTG